MRIFRTEIYGVDCIGMNDSFVPDEYLCFGDCVGTSERLVFSKDGKFYVCYDFEAELWEFKDYLLSKLEMCEELIDEHDMDVEWEKRKKAGVTTEQINEELREQIRIAKMKLAKKEEKK